MTRPMMVSIQPPNQPATRPMRLPMMNGDTTASTATLKSTRAP
jgi:hypothetical protein